MATTGSRAQPIERVLEAILFVGGEPMSAETFRRSFPGVTQAEFERGIQRLRERYHWQRRPYVIRRSKDGYYLSLTAESQKELQSALPADRGIKLSRPIIEALSVVAYRQPIGKEEIETVLGVDAGPALRQLLKRRLIERQDVAQADNKDNAETKAFVTTPRFLEIFQLESLAELPITEDFSRP